MDKENIEESMLEFFQVLYKHFERDIYRKFEFSDESFLKEQINIRFSTLAYDLLEKLNEEPYKD